MQIWKFQLKLTDRQAVMMPRCAKLLTVQVQCGVLCLWAIVDPAANKASRHITIAGTGYELPANATPETYIGTVQDGSFVWHVFDC